MPIYAKKISKSWTPAFKRFESMSGFEPMFQEAIDSGEMTEAEAFQENLRWFENVYAEVMNIKTPDL